MQNREPGRWLPQCENPCSILENSPDCMGLLDGDGRFITINQSCRNLLALGDVSAAQGREWRLLWPESARAQVDMAMAAAKAEGEGRFRGWCPAARGELRYWDVIVTRLPNGGRGNSRFLTVSRDITDIKRMEDALRWSARCNALMSEAAGDLLQGDNPRAIVENFCRKAMVDLDCQFFFNFLFDEPTGCLRLHAFAGVSEDEARKFEKLDYGMGLSGCVVRNCETASVCTADSLRTALRGSHSITAYCCFPLAARGRVIGAISFASCTRSEFNDSEIEVMDALSHLVSMALSRAQTERALCESDRRKDEFISTLAHELRNPLSAIRNGFNVLDATGGAAMPQLRPMLDRQLDLLVRLVDDLLDTARIKTGKIELKKQRVDLASVINQSIEGVRLSLQSRSQDVTVRLPSEALFVEGDPARLAQVFTNLLDNASKYTAPNGRIDVCAQKQGAEAFISFRDTGIGIPAEKIESIFDMFEQIAGHPCFRDGLGVGLSLARGLIEQHGGKLKALSDGLGRGSEFLVRLPLSLRSPDNEKDKCETAIGSTRAACRVLVVDDERDVADILVMLLQSLGAEARAAYSGEEAMHLLADFKPRLVLLDIGMPGMSGYETARRIRELTEGRSLFLAALSGWGTESDKRLAKEAGFNQHFLKPITVESLQAVMSAAEQATGA
jgi:PAS domain S-box-containing protein